MSSPMVSTTSTISIPVSNSTYPSSYTTSTPALDSLEPSKMEKGKEKERTECSCEVPQDIDDLEGETEGLSLQQTYSSTSPSIGRKYSGEFTRFGLPSRSALEAAQECILVGESGQPVRFGDLVKERETVVVVFLRHLWCGLCQQYVTALQSATKTIESLPSSSPAITPIQSVLPSPSVVVSEPPILVNEPSALLRPESGVSDKAGSDSAISMTSTNDILVPRPPLYIILISTGSPSLIPVYRQRLQCPLPLYVNKSRDLYKCLGMNRKTLSGGKESEKGSYVTRTNFENVLDSVKSGVSMMRYPGNQSQLGGEFVFTSKNGGDIECTYVSRMSTTRNHGELKDLFAAAGVSLSLEDQESVFGGSNHS